MKIKTLTGPSIQATLAEARRLFGDDVLLLESTAATGERPAQITVMADPATRPAAAPQGRPAPAKPAFEPLAAMPAYGYAPATDAPTPARQEESAAVLFDLSSARSGGAAHSARPRGTLFQAAPSPSAPADLERLEQALGAQLQRLHDRLDGLEQAGAALLGTAQRWAAHPLFAELTARGLRPETTSRLFRGVVERGFLPADRSGERLAELRWALAQELRALLGHTMPPRSVGGALAFVGPAGAGKTTLLLKVATHPSFYGRRRTAVLVLDPGEDDLHPHQDATDLYRRYGLAVQRVRTSEEASQALDRAATFDQLLIDTPPLPARRADARRLLLRVQELLREVVPLDVHLVLDATRALDGFDAAYLQSLPLHPAAAALTRLDETLGWGRVADWLIALDLPVQFVSTDAQVPHGVQQYSPSWFVESFAKLAIDEGPWALPHPRT